MCVYITCYIFVYKLECTEKWKSEEFTLAGKLDFFLNSPLGISEADLGKASVEPGFPYAI